MEPGLRAPQHPANGFDCLTGQPEFDRLLAIGKLVAHRCLRERIAGDCHTEQL
jgi:hypothetical protein